MPPARETGGHHMLIVTIQVNAPPGSAECVKEVLGMALEQLGDARVVSIREKLPEQLKLDIG